MQIASNNRHRSCYAMKKQVPTEVQGQNHNPIRQCRNRKPSFQQQPTQDTLCAVYANPKLAFQDMAQLKMFEARSGYQFPEFY